MALSGLAQIGDDEEKEEQQKINDFDQHYVQFLSSNCTFNNMDLEILKIVYNFLLDLK